MYVYEDIRQHIKTKRVDKTWLIFLQLLLLFIDDNCGTVGEILTISITNANEGFKLKFTWLDGEKDD